MSPKVSVILTSFNHEKYIGQAIESILAQTFQDFEVIIYDDCSSDKSWEIICGFEDDRIRKFRSESNERGLVNKGLLEVRGELVAIHHSDDVWEKDKLAKQVNVLDGNPNLGAVFTWVRMIDETGVEVDNDWFNYSYTSNVEIIRDLFRGVNRLAHPSILIRKACYDKVGIYHKEFLQLPDMHMWVRVISNYEIYVVQECLTIHRVFSDLRNTSAKRKDVSIRLENEMFHFMGAFRNLSVAQMFEVFESIRPFYGKERDPEFLLAWAAVYEGARRSTKAWGLMVLYSIMSNPERAEVVRSEYGFDYWSLVTLSGGNDVFCVSALEQLGEINQKLQLQNVQLIEELSQIKQSRSWRFVRAVAHITRYLRLK